MNRRVLQFRIFATTACYPCLFLVWTLHFERWWQADLPTRTLSLAATCLGAIFGAWLLLHERPRLVKRIERLREGRWVR